MIEGLVQGRYEYEVQNRRDLGRLWQIELSELGTRSLCAVVCTEDPGPIPNRSHVRTKGFFIKVRGYRTSEGVEGAGPLIVARNLEVVRSPASSLPALGRNVDSAGAWLVGLIALLAAAWLILRVRIRRRSAAPAIAPTGRGASSGTEGEFDWLIGRPDRGDRDGP